ncbi:Beta-lactamase-like protein [Macrophomina phaseolina MS6]|uniref:Beta-lactamase-like protein n=2 Tax=Macrophomina phaseolina TaxID=35725 RepID=K2RET4_MACPH|nr:Beta-lactamase-like protein [Macrophomina phaseolina MS6]KAH7056925.1 beta-lactamase-like protein [Macrophomina phaseolina]
MSGCIELVNNAPKGTKLWLLNLGYLECDVGFLFQNGGGNLSTRSNPNPPRARRKLVAISALVEHPTEGLILFETGTGRNYPEVVGPQTNDVFAQIEYEQDQDLDKAIAKTGHDVKDVRAVILGHLHADHAGGLEYFFGTNVPIYVHEKELKNAFYSVATGSDYGCYLPHYLRFDLNWQTFHGDFLELAPGLNIHHAPGHTPGLCILQVNLQESGTWIFTSDMYHVKENYESSIPQGWLAREHDSWIQSNQMIKRLAKRTKANVVLGHCVETLAQYKNAPEFYL